ncbi:MAG: peptidoglycan DD-metalloendopeptidase family protein [Gemmatimonadetes bacterium]|nr:peptidoglycan DD-metalloendopeptidase family protein [Gemmatimonadota bacterium]NIO31787.1 peptidoglycan DD-metalloendopeptidase family protein [Gemmatimonadota bacterium]
MWAELLGDMSAAADRLVWVGRWELLFSIVLFVIVFGLTLALRNASPVLRHALWGLVLLRLVLPVGLASPFSIGSIVSQGTRASGAESSWIVEWPELQAAGGAAGFGGQLTGTGTEPSLSGLPIVALWLVGVVAVGASLVRRRRRYAGVIRNAAPVLDARAQSLTECWRNKFGVRRAVRLITSGELGTPFTWGSVRPVVYLPEAVLGHEDAAVLESVIGHEIAHIKRWDDLQLVLQLIVSAFYFFNPVGWLSASRMREESERICDELVLSHSDLSPAAYGRCIVAVARLGFPGEAGPLPALSNSKKRLQMRIRSMKKLKIAATRRLRVAYSLPTAFAFGVFLLPMASGARSDTSSETELASPRQESDIALANPMPGSRVSAAWGPMINPFTGKEAHHRGIDLVGRAGARIHAAGDGVVEQATTEYSGGADHGTVVVLDHGGGIKTFYSHLESLAVQEGQRVSQGDVLGTQGATGKTTGPHLHFEVWVNGEYVDPALYVGEWHAGAPTRSNAIDN